MGKVVVNESSLQEIAGALREKTKGDKTYYPAEMGGAIRDLQLGEGEYAWKRLSQGEADTTHTLLMHFDEAVRDDSAAGKVLTNNGVTITDEQSRFGGMSAYFDGTGHIASTDLSILPPMDGDWTIDWWDYPTVTTAGCRMWVRSSGGGTYGLLVGYSSSDGRVMVMGGTGGSSWDVINMTIGNVVLNTWTHRAIVKSGNTYYGFENGTLIASKTGTGTIAAVYEPLIGKYMSGGFTGYMDEFHISNVALWTSNFTPPRMSYNAYEFINEGYVVSDDVNAYPQDGIADDGFYYKMIDPEDAQESATGTVNIASGNTSISVHGLGFKPSGVVVYNNYNDAGLNARTVTAVATDDGLTFVAYADGTYPRSYTAQSYLARTFTDDGFVLTLNNVAKPFLGDYRWIAYGGK